MSRLRRRHALSAAIEPLEERRLLSVWAGTASTARQPAGPLSGKVVFTVGGHGFTAFTSGWHTQRGENNEMVEDLGNQDQMTAFVDYLWNAGATVVPLRPVGYQPNEVVLDNDSAQVTWTGSWSNSTSTIFYGSAGDTPYRYSAVSATQTATARYTPNIPQAGFYPIYTWVKDDTDRVNQLYRVVHPGGTTEVRVNHKMVGKGWVYLGTYYLNAGSGAYVEISNQASGTGNVIADAIRFGNGMGSIDRGLGVSGQTRSDESALYWIESQKGQGVSDSVFRGTIDTDDNDNVSAPPKWAAWMNREGTGAMTDRLFLSFHSNAGGGRGTVGLYNNETLFPNTATPNQFAWAQLVGKEVNDDLVAMGAPPLEYAWNNRGTNITYARSDYAFGEINDGNIGGEFDATLVEVAFHDNASDAALMRDPKVRTWVARASYQAAVRYFNTFGGGTLAFAPEAPTNVRAVADAAGDVTVSWTAPTAGSPGGDAATGYVVYTSSDGYAFGNPIVISGGANTSYKFSQASLGSGVKYFRVVATNAGGDSLPTEVVAARSGPSGLASILIVNGFDRMDRTLDVRQTTPLSYDPPFTGGSTFDRVRPRFSNSADYVTQAASAIAAYGTVFGIDSCQNNAVTGGQINLANYKAVIWMCGEEGVTDKTLDATEQSKLTTYLNAGGKLFISGSEIGFDLVGNGAGATFYNSTLKSGYVSDDAGTYTASGAAGSIFAGLSLTFDNGSLFYDVDSPDVISASGGSTVAMNYTGAGSGAAALQYAGGNTRIVNLAFPFETITTAANRNAVMSAVLTFFNIGSQLPGTPANPTPADGAVLAAAPAKLDWDDVSNATSYNVYVGTSTTPYAVYTSEVPLFGPADGLRIWRVVAVNNDGETSGPTWSYTLDRAAPTAVYNGQTPNVGASTMDFTITYTDAVTGLNASTFDNADITVSGPNGYSAPATFVSANTPGNGSPRTVTYRIPAPGGQWTLLDNGIYSVQLNSAQVADVAGNAAAQQTLGSFTTDLPFAWKTGVTMHVDFDGTATPITLATSGSAITATRDGVTLSFTGVSMILAGGTSASDTLNWAGPIAPALNFTGNGGSDSLAIQSGTFTFAADAATSISRTLDLSVADGAAVVFNATQHLHSLTVAPNARATFSANAQRYLQTDILSIAPSGTLDLNDNHLVVNAGDFGAIRDLLFAGYSGTPDTSKSGIISTTGQSAGNTILALLDNAVLGASEWPLGSGNAISATAVVGKYSLFGDANLDGAVTSDDYAILDANLGTTPAPGLAWISGDANFDGIISPDDYAILDANLGL